MIIHPYKMYSESARAVKRGLLAAGVDCYLSTKQPSPRSFVVNWGDNGSEWLNTHPRVLNRPSAIRKLTNKLAFFETCGHHKNVIPWTTERSQANAWEVVYERHRLEGTGGEGIVVSRGLSKELGTARLYTKGVRGTAEYRVHVARDHQSGDFSVLDTQRKVCPKGTTPTSWAIRSHENGFIYTRGCGCPETVCSVVCELASRSLVDLDFAAFDVIYSAVSNRCWVLEGNSAPGLEGKTVQTYVDYFKGFMV